MPYGEARLVVVGVKVLLQDDGLTTNVCSTQGAEGFGLAVLEGDIHWLAEPCLKLQVLLWLRCGHHG